MGNKNNKKQIKEWHLSDLSQIKEITSPHKREIIQLLVLKDGRLASCSKDGSIKIFGENLIKKIDIMEHADWVTSILQLEDGRILSTSKDGTIKIFNLFTNVDYIVNSILVEDKFEKYQAINFILSEKEKFILTSSNEKVITIWKFDKKKKILKNIRTIKEIDYSHFFMYDLQNGCILIQPYSQSIMDVYDFKKGKKIKNIFGIDPPPKEKNQIIVFKNYIFSLGNNQVIVVDKMKYEVIEKLDLNDVGSCIGLTLDNKIIMGTNNGAMQILDFDEENHLSLVDRKEGNGKGKIYDIVEIQSGYFVVAYEKEISLLEISENSNNQNNNANNQNNNANNQNNNNNENNNNNNENNNNNNQNNNENNNNNNENNNQNNNENNENNNN